MTSFFIPGILTGLFAGCVVAAYRAAVEFLCEVGGEVFAGARDNIWICIALFAGLFAVGAAMWTLCKKMPEVAGGGTIAVKDRIVGIRKSRFGTLIAAKFVGSATAIASGLSLGTEGPSIQLGATAGEGVSHLFRKNADNIIMAGAAAGISAAFGAPLAGFFFAFEELSGREGRKNYLRHATVAVASVTAFVLSAVIFGPKPLFSLSAEPLSATEHLLLALLAPLCALLGWAFTKLMVVFKKLFGSLRLWKYLLLFGSAGVVGIFWREICGGGSGMILSGPSMSALGTVALLFVGKAVFTSISNASSAPGGILLPTLALGAMVGAGFALAFAPSAATAFVILGMAGMLASAGKVPVMTGALVLEMTGCYSLILPVAITVALSYGLSAIKTHHGIFDRETWA